MTEITLTTDEKHTITLRGDQTVEIVIDGRAVGCIDFFNLIDGSGPLQLIVDGGPCEEPLAKVLFPAGKPPVLVVHKDAKQDWTINFPNAIHHEYDQVFVGEET